MAHQHRKQTVVAGPRVSAEVEQLVRAFDRAAPAQKPQFEPVLLDAIAKAERDGRVADSLRLKLRLLEIRSRRGVL